MSYYSNAQKLRPIIERAADSLDDTSALNAPTLFRHWADGETVAAGDRRYYPDTRLLYKARQGHTTQADWTPDITPALWAAVCEEQSGSIDEPIEAVRGMEYEFGLYYLDIEDGKRYLCKRGNETGTIVLHYLPHELVGNYFEEATTT